MNNIVCIGAQWGDEGKGRVIDSLAKDADVVVRFHGGNNAGHTVIVEGVKTVLHIVPSGILHEDKLCVIGSGCVIDPEVLLQELDALEARGIKDLYNPERLLVSDQAHVILPFHKRIDRAREAAAGSAKIGTTGRGIGPVYEDKVARRGFRMHDLVNPSLVGDAVRKAAAHANSVLQTLDGEIFKGEEVECIISHLKEQGLRLKPIVADTGLRIYEANKRGKKILFEGAQGTLLDVDHGTYPFVTSSNCLSAYAAVGSGVGPGLLGKVLGVMKAYSTRVGEGPFPTEMLDSKGQDLRMRGAEFGATTGRPRRTGWLDLVALKYAVRVNGITNLAITKLDILSGFGELKVCTGYNIDETYVNNFPRDFKDLQKAKPLYQTFNGFEFNAESVRSISDLPENARLYLNFISSHLDTPISIVGVGPGRGQEIIVNPI